jgi:hypothetical protein
MLKCAVRADVKVQGAAGRAPISPSCSFSFAIAPKGVER